MTASRGTEVFHPDEHRDPRLDAVAGFGRSIAQPPLQLPVVEHKGYRANMDAIRHSKNTVLRRKHFQQRINAAIRKGLTPEKAWFEMASRPGRK